MLQQASRPYVQFETKAVPYQDGDGHTMYRNQYFVSITSKGSKDSVYKDAESWISELKHKSQARQGFDMDAPMYDEWYRIFSEAFNRYKEGQEFLFDGTPIKASMAFSPAEVANCESIRLYSMEDLANCSEEAVQRLGIGGRNLKNKAAKILENTQGGRVAEENAALRVKLDALTEQMENLMKLIPASPAQQRIADHMDDDPVTHVDTAALEKFKDDTSDSLTNAILGKPRGRPPKHVTA